MKRQTSRSSRSAFALAGVALPVLLCSVAYACTSLATLSLGSTSFASGTTVSGTGRGFDGGQHGEVAGTTPVELRWNSRFGPVLTSATPDPAGLISFSFTVPSLPPGQYVLIGVQNNPATGSPFYGTPARLSVEITSAASAASQTSAVAPVAVRDETGSDRAPSAAASPATSPAPAVSAVAPSAPGVPAAPVAAAGPVAATRPVQARPAPPSPPLSDPAAAPPAHSQPVPAVGTPAPAAPEQPRATDPHPAASTPDHRAVESGRTFPYDLTLALAGVAAMAAMVARRALRTAVPSSAATA